MGSMLGRVRAPAVVVAAAVVAVLLAGGPAMAGDAVVSDGAHVLSRSDVSTLTDAASHVGSDAVRIYTATGLANDPMAFDDHYAKKLDGADPATIIIGVNTRSRHVTVHGGTRSHLHRKQSAAAVAAFTGAMRANRGYAGALLTMVQSLQRSVTGHVTPAGGAASGGAATTATGGAHPAAAHAGKSIGGIRLGGLGMGAIAVGGVVAILVIALVVMSVRAASGNRRGRGRRRGEWA